MIDSKRARLMLELLNPSMTGAAKALADIARFRLKVAMTPASRKPALVAQRFMSPSRRDWLVTPARLLADLRRFAPDWEQRLAGETGLESRMAAIIETQSCSELSLGGQLIKLYRWTPPTVKGAKPRHALLSHGWESYAHSYALIIERLLQLGYTVHAMDHAAHGASSGTYSGLPRFAEVLHDVADHLQRQGIAIDLGVGHSLGGGAWLMAATKLGVKAERLLLLAPFIDTPELLSNWLKLHGLPTQLRPDMQVAMMALHGKTPMEFADMEIAQLAKRLSTPTVIVQDPKDFVAPMRHSRQLAKANELVQCIKAEGAGHVGVLFDTVSLSALS
jgi:pimeloyl-ACP methyl ester carboxylesterase